MKVKKDDNTFVSGKDTVYYSIFTKKPFAAEVQGMVTLRSYADNTVTKIEDINSNDKKLMRPVNPVTAITAAGKYAIEIAQGEKILARKVFTVTEDKAAAKKDAKKEEKK